jgi:hypothetical protein
MKPKSGERYAIDNGAWGYHQQGQPFDAGAFNCLLRRYGSGADWAVAPDVVAGGLASLQVSLQFLTTPERSLCDRWLLAVQDGMEPGDIRPHLSADVGIFVGGSTDWKLETMPVWGRLAAERGAYLHVARVNTLKRIQLARWSGAHSFDGTSAIRFPSTIPMLTNGARQLPLFRSTDGS